MGRKRGGGHTRDSDGGDLLGGIRILQGFSLCDAEHEDFGVFLLEDLGEAGCLLDDLVF